jgi:hypothetical protein
MQITEGALDVPGLSVIRWRHVGFVVDGREVFLMLSVNLQARVARPLSGQGHIAVETPRIARHRPRRIVKKIGCRLRIARAYVVSCVVPNPWALALAHTAG